MYCQVCSALQSDEAEYCSRCQQKLLVLSGPTAPDDLSFAKPEESFSFDEHLLERISILEDVLKKTTDTVRGVLGLLQKQEKNILINHTGLATLAEHLESREAITRGDWSELWEARAQAQLLALEKRDGFRSSRERIAALYRGKRRGLFLQHLEEAELALLSFDLPKAIASLEAAYGLDRENYELAHFLGETFFNEGRADQALSYFAEVLEVKEDHYEGLVYSGVILYERGDHEHARRFLQQALSLYPDSFLPLFSLGAIAAANGELAQAVELLERAVEVERVPQALYLLGSCHYERSSRGSAISALKEAVHLDPTFEEAHHVLGLAYLDRHWTRKALESFRRAQSLNPKKMRYQDLVQGLSGEPSVPLPEVGAEAADWLSRGERLFDEKKSHAAIECYREALVLEPDNPTVLISHALACLQVNRNEESATSTRRILELDAGEMLKATACATLIEALRGEGRYREGNVVGDRLLSEGTSSFARTIAYYEMAYNLAEMEEDLDRALDYARRSLELAPEELKHFSLAALGWVHYKRNEFDKAVDFLSRSTEFGLSSATLTHLGMALLASGEEERARLVLAEARNLGDQDGALQERMMEFMRESTRLLESVRVAQRRGAQARAAHGPAVHAE